VKSIADARRLLTINTGSSSLKAALYRLREDTTETPELRAEASRIGGQGGGMRLTDERGETLEERRDDLPDHAAALDARTSELDLSPQARQQLESEKVDLGAAEVPEGVSGETAASVEGAVAESFVAGFRVAMVAAAILAVASAVASALIIEGKGSAQRTELETAPA
jgi:hypothetical protein